MHSLSESLDLTCGECGRALAFELWLIVDAGERPDLLARARAGDLHTVTCPICGPLGEIDAPLLLYLPDHNPATGQPPLIFSPAAQTSAEQDQQMAAGLLRELAGRLGAAWQNDWLAQVVSVRRDLLPVALSDDPAAAMRERMEREGERGRAGEWGEEDEAAEMPAGVAAVLMEVAAALAAEGVTLTSPDDLARALAERPELAARLEEALRTALAEDDEEDADDDAPAANLPGSCAASGKVDDDTASDTLADLIEHFVGLDTWDEAQRMVEANPALLSDGADALLAFAIAQAQAGQDAGTVEHFTMMRGVLRRCREAGIARAFAEQMLPPEGLAEAERLGMTPEEFLAEMHAVQDRMPPALREVLETLADEGADIRSIEELQRALAARPDLAARLQGVMLDAAGEEDNAPATQGIDPPGTAEPTAVASPSLPVSPSPPTVTRYTDIACPRRVWIGAERLAVVVRLTVAPPTRSAAQQRFSVRVDAPVQIRLTAPAFDLLNAADQTTPILPDADSPPVVFDLRPRVAGATSLVFDFRQAGNPLGTAVAPIEITSYAVVDAPESRGGAALQLPEGIDPPDLILTIHYDTTGGAPRLLMTLEETATAGVITFDPAPLRSDPARAAAALYEELTSLAEQAASQTDDATFLAELNDAVQQLGFKLWHDLIPAGLKELYLARQAAWADKTLLVVSDEPHIPWELVWPYNQATGQADAAPWAVTLRLLRWLRRDAVSTGYAGPPAVIPLRRLACVAPDHTGLVHLVEERDFLRNLLHALALDDVSPSVAQRRAVLRLLRQGGYDWVHFITHGAPPHADTPPGAIELEDAHLLPGDLIGPQAESHIHRVRPGFVLNVCHSGRQTWGLTQLDGWANVLLGAGAGLVVAPRWAVTDRQALAFAQSFYRHLLGNMPVAQAVHAARCDAFAVGDPTWLAYSVYAHPQARASY